MKKSSFHRKCPSCGSKNIHETPNLSISLYAMKAIKCRECGREFELSERLRVSVFIFIFGLFVLNLLTPYIKDSLGNSASSVVYIAFFIFSIGNYTYSLISNPLQDWSTNSQKRKVINYGTTWSFIFIGIFVIGKFL